MRLGFIGAGKMGEAFLESLLRAGVAAPDACLAADPDAARLRALRERLGVRAAAANSEAARAATVLFLAVKPQQLDGVLREIAPVVAESRPLVLSIAAGKRLAAIEALLPGARVIRVMPNVCCLVGEGMNVYTAGGQATGADRALAQRLLAACGQAREMPEPLFDAVTALSGSGPAFFARFFAHLVEGAVAEGMAEADARLLAAQTMLGTARLLLGPQPDPAELVRQVASPRGTTAEGLVVLDNSPFAGLARGAIAAAARRSRELGAPGPAAS